MAPRQRGETLRPVRPKLRVSKGGSSDLGAHLIAGRRGSLRATLIAAGTTVGNIRLDTLLGQGGMGEVYLGFDPRLERRVAVKTIRPDKRPSPQAKARFLREARLLSKLGHPAICQVYDLIETPTADFLVLEYVEGKTLKQRIADGGTSAAEKLALAEKVAAALAVAHRERIVHRDLKADNVMVTPAGEVKVLDFGIARSLGEGNDGPPATVAEVLPDGDDLGATLDYGAGSPRPEGAADPEDTDEATLFTRVGGVVGTVVSMSPEQAAGGRVTEASDLYSLGILLHELFTGQPAYLGRTADQILPQVLRGETRPRPGLDPDLSALIGELLSLDPYARPSALQACRRLAEIADKPQRQRRRRLRLAALAAAFVALAVGLAAVTYFAVAAERARRQADRRRGQAESLIRFMMSDLGPRLDAVGRLDLLESVGNQALAYFDALPEAELTDGELKERIAAIRQISEVRSGQGNLPAAAAAALRSLTLARGLTARDPGARPALAELSSSTCPAPRGSGRKRST
jgi:predicted Ser/Thr protein kinase